MIRGNERQRANLLLVLMLIAGPAAIVGVLAYALAGSGLLAYAATLAAVWLNPLARS